MNKERIHLFSELGGYLNREIDNCEFTFMYKLEHPNLTPVEIATYRIQRKSEFEYMSAVVSSYFHRFPFFNFNHMDPRFPWKTELEVPISEYNKYMEMLVKHLHNKRDGFIKNNGIFNLTASIDSYSEIIILVNKMIEYRNAQEYLIMSK
jgi:hypothetical protein